MPSPGRAGRLAAVIGYPVRHSLSPAMHEAAFAHAGRDWAFTRFEIVDGGVDAAIAAMEPLGIGGYAVTMPHKQAAARSVDDVEPAAQALGAVNTVVLRDDGTTFGASTDGRGFVDALAAADVDVEGARIVVLGAGGAARAIVDALGRSGVADIAVVNRTAAAAAAAARLAGPARTGSLADVGRADVLVNATSIGMGTEASPIDRAILCSDLVVADIVYHPLRTSLLRDAEAAGARVVDGLGMLVHQAVLQHELWTGHRPDPQRLRAAAEAELDRRA